MKNLRLILLCAVHTYWLQAQSLDSLKNALAPMPEDTHKVLALRQLYRSMYMADEINGLLDVAESGLRLSQKLKFATGLNFFLFAKASALDILGRSREAIPFFEEGLLLAQKAGDRKAEADYHVNLGTAHHSLGNADKSLQHYIYAYEIYKNTNQFERLSKILNNIGIHYRTQKQYERAEAIYKESLALKEKMNDSLGMAAAHQNLAALFSIIDRHKDAIIHSQKALAFYAQLNRKDDVAGCHSLLGQIYFNNGERDLAKVELQKAIDGYQNDNNGEYSPATYQLLGIIHATEKNFAVSESYFTKALSIARKFGLRDRQYEILTALSKVEQSLGKHKLAYAHLEEASVIRDSIIEGNRLSLIAEMQTKFDLSQKDTELKINQLSLRQRTVERNWLIAGTVLLGLFSVAIFWGLRNRMRSNAKIAAQASALQQQQIIQLEQENKLTALQSMINGQEQERNRIAADLHDGLGGLLSSVKSHFNAIPKPSAASELFGQTNRLIDEACVEVRRISHNMMPRALSLSGLPDALEDLAQDLQKHGIHCQLELIGMEEPLDPAQSVTLYRILQELTNNVVKHAQASQLLLQLIRRDGALTIIVEDNGKGFDVQKAKIQKGLGLANIESRVKFLQGAIEWDSVQGQGTVVSIFLKPQPA